MKNNLIEKFELIDGTAIFNNNFKIVTANESMYRFMGISLEYYLMNVIHQVDIEDFMDVCNGLRLNQQKNMVLRMRRSDNSFRWMLITIKKCAHAFSNDTVEEYFELHASDIIAMKSQNERLHDTVRSFRHILATENELLFSYDHLTKVICINQFIDNNEHKIIEVPIDEFYSMIVNNKLIVKEDIEQFQVLCDDIKCGKSCFSHKLHISFDIEKDCDLFEFNGHTIYSDMKPNESVGGIKNISDDKNSSYSFNTLEYSNTNHHLSYDNVREFCIKNIKYNPDCKFTLFLIEVNNIENYIKEHGREFTEKLHEDIIHTARIQLGYRGAVCTIKENLIAIAVKDIYSDIDIRAFVESLRTHIKWQYKQIDPYYNIAFSMGIAHYPNNGHDLGQINRQLVRALEIAESKHTDCFVIYREHLHGEID